MCISLYTPVLLLYNWDPGCIYFMDMFFDDLMFTINTFPALYMIKYVHSDSSKSARIFGAYMCK